MSVARHARVPALAKINLDLRVLGKRPDGFHELRTIFQTISLGDKLDVSFTPARRTTIALDDPLDIPDNLVSRAARLALDAMRVNGRVELRLAKRIPMGAGLGGGSSDAAAVLLALPAVAGRAIPLPELTGLAAQLGSTSHSSSWEGPRPVLALGPNCSRCRRCLGFTEYCWPPASTSTPRRPTATCRPV